MPEYPTAQAHATACILPKLQCNLSSAERLKLYKSYIAVEEERVKQAHKDGLGGIATAERRAQFMDIVMESLWECAAGRYQGKGQLGIALVAIGGYGRGALNPGSDIDLLFLLPTASNKLTKERKDVVEEVLYLLWDLGFKVGHSSRSVAECIEEADRDPLNRTALIDMRCLAGNEILFDDLLSSFYSSCLEGDIDDFLAERQKDINARRKKFSETVYLQEPNIKEAPGGMRDYHNLMWVLYARRRKRSLQALVDERLLSTKAFRELNEGFDFLHRVRNELHYYNNSGSDLLTLRLQGIVADAFSYPQKNILRRIEAFMRDYYTHAKNIHQHTTSIFESFEIEIEDRYKQSWTQRLFSKAPKRQSFSAYYSQGGRIYPADRNIFDADPSRLMRMFLHAQERSLRLSPKMRRLIKSSIPGIDDDFRTDLEVRKAFRRILEKKGEIARSLRQMHRVGFLGAFLPEFGALTCLVQHEFFHRYTADEHTLRCIDQLDRVHSDEAPDTQIYRQIYRDIPDTYPLIIAILMHDAGRAENVREHIDGSAVLAAQVCDRLRIRGEQRRLITFLVDHHLTLFRYATKYDIDDPDVVAEFAAQMKEPELLDTMLLFTYVDSLGTSEDNWTKWKESLILRLYKSAREMMRTGAAGSREEFEANKADLLNSALQTAKPAEEDEVRLLFELMPDSYLRYRYPGELALHARAVYQYKELSKANPDGFECAVQWLEKEKLGFTDMVIASKDRAHLLERVAFVLAKENINILSADIYTRIDGIALDLFRITTKQGAAVSNKAKQEKIISSIYKTVTSNRVTKSELKSQTSLMDRGDTGVKFPTRAWINDDASSDTTVIDLQAVDRLGLLFEILRCVRRENFVVNAARICTEKGAAMDSLYILDADGSPISDRARVDKLVTRLNQIISAVDPTLEEAANVEE